MSRILLIGIDGLDWPVLEPMLTDLPALGELRSKGYSGLLKSVFPPDSIPSWVSIFTGLDPSEHGVLETIDYFKKDVKKFALDTAPFRGRTFWDLAGGLDKKVIVVNPLLAYPPWEVDGIMASGPVFISGRSKIHPKSHRLSAKLPPLGGIIDFPEKGELEAFAKKTRGETSGIVDFTAELLSSESWDLAFVSILTLDRIFHFFWRYFDPGDPTHPGESEHAGVISDFHRFMDECVGILRAAAGSGTLTMVFSDHGHFRRPPLLFNLNQLLLERGYLKSRFEGPKILNPRYHIERMKNFTLETLHRLDMEDLAYRIARLFPWTRKLKKSDFLTEPSVNLATASDFGGNNPFGGVDISRERCTAEGVDYEEFRDELIELLSSVSGESGEQVFLWVKRREELYSGRYLERFPDLLYEMRPCYGTNWSIHLPLVTVNPRHRKISGGHRESGAIIAGPLDDLHIVPELVSPLNISATVLSVLAGDEGRMREMLPERVRGKAFLQRNRCD